MARQFDGDDQWLGVTGTPVSGEPFAFAASFYATSDQYRTILSIGDSAGTYYFALRLQAADPAGVVAAMVYDGSTKDATSTANYALNTLNYGCAIYAATNDRRAFLNGGNKGTNAEARNAVTMNRTTIGVSADSTPLGYFSGYIAEAGVWDLTNWPGATASDKADEFERVAVPALAAGYSPLFFMLGLNAYWSEIRSDQDRVGGYDMTAYNAPTIAAHPPVIYPAMPFIITAPAAAPAGRTTYNTDPRPLGIHAGISRWVNIP